MQEKKKHDRATYSAADNQLGFGSAIAQNATRCDGATALSNPSALLNATLNGEMG